MNWFTKYSTGLLASAILLGCSEIPVDSTDTSKTALPADFSAATYLEVNPDVQAVIVADEVKSYNTEWMIGDLSQVILWHTANLEALQGGCASEDPAVVEAAIAGASATAPMYAGEISWYFCAGDLSYPAVLAERIANIDTHIALIQDYLDKQRSGIEVTAEAEAAYPLQASMISDLLSDAPSGSASPYMIAKTFVENSVIKPYTDIDLAAFDTEFPYAASGDTTTILSEAVFETMFGLEQGGMSDAGIFMPARFQETFNVYGYLGDPAGELAFIQSLIDGISDERVENDYIFAGSLVGRPYRYCVDSDISASSEILEAHTKGEDLSDNYYCYNQADSLVYSIAE
jgi:hypothetical protein